ncbi:alanine racemase [Candidatus Uhrbacteria bacterium]|nr:alanine racemase [Candidatus Uhrbacteria bacterium]
MFVKQERMSKKNVVNILDRRPEGEEGDLYPLVKMAMKKQAMIKKIAAVHPTPFYLFDRELLAQQIQEFTQSFSSEIPGIKFFYAVKTNDHPFVLKSMVAKGLGLDVSSARELQLGVRAGAQEMLFSGPGKTGQELNVFLRHQKSTTLIIDSADELDRIGRITKGARPPLGVGVRFFSSHHGSWSKFGIPLTDLGTFWRRLQQYPTLRLAGLHFHCSLNRTPDRHVAIIKELGSYLKGHASIAMRKDIRFIDFGGGFYPDRVEGFYPWAERYPWMFSGGYLMKRANEHFDQRTSFAQRYYITRADSPAVFARAIARVIDTSLRPLVDAQYYCEPGRIVSHAAMHIILRVVDRKSGMIITDGGNNMVGWEAGNQFYYPIVNITHPSKKEKPIIVYGSLCNPKDLWGYYAYGAKFDQEDVLVIPMQGAYRFTLAQEFIRAIPPVYSL